MKRFPSAVRYFLFLVILGTASLLVSRSLGHLGWGSGFLPHPDSLEYAAGAQSLSSNDGYSLHVGPHRVPPRYPPGWPLLLSLALRCGVPATSLWYINGILNMMISFIIVLMVIKSVQGLQQGVPRVSQRTITIQAAIFGLYGGLLWALSPQAAFLGLTILSDLPALLFLLCFGFLFFTCLVRVQRQQPIPAGLWLACGLLLSMTTAIRFINTILMAPALLVLCAGYWRSFSRTSALRALGGLAAGFLGGLTVVSMISGLPPWNWSSYEFWVPRWCADLTDMFGFNYALHGNPDRAVNNLVKSQPHLIRGIRLLGGFSGQHPIFQLGRWWPMAGWLGLGAVLLAPLEARTGRRARWLVGCLGVCVLSHFIFYSFFYTFVSRYFLTPMAICIVSLPVGLSCLASGCRSVVWKVSAHAMMIGVILFTAMDLGRIPPPSRYRQPGEEVRAGVAEWRRLGPEERSRRDLPFDPVHAQALGLLPPDERADLSPWGKLPRTTHVIRLQHIGIVDKREMSGKPENRKKPSEPRGPEGTFNR